MDHIYFNFHSLSYLISSLITLYILISILNLKSNNKSAKIMVYLYISMVIAYFAYFICCSFYNKFTAYHRIFTILGSLMTCTFILQLMLAFPKPLYQKTAKVIGITQISLNTFITLVFFIFAIKSDFIYYFGGNHWDFNLNEISTYIGYFLLFYVTIFTAFGFFLIVKRKGKDRTALIWINIAFFIMGFISSVVNILSRLEMFSREIYISYFCLSTIIGIFILTITYINHTSDRATLLFKIISVSFALILSTFASTGFVVYKTLEKNYDNQSILKIEAMIHGNNQIEREFFEINDRSSYNGNSFFKEYIFNENEVPIITYTVYRNGVVYRAGFNYLSYRKEVHDTFKYLILIVFAVSGIVIIGFKFFFLNSLIEPLQNLINGITKVNNSNYNTEIEVRYEDEIGFLTYAFNAMTAGLSASRTQLQDYANRLEEMVKQKTVELIKTREELIRSEKMASLGSLVAGVAHEINTPIGIGVTSASHLSSETQKTIGKLNNNQLAKSELYGYFETAEQSTAIILNNLFRASELIKSFKKVAVDQSTEEKRVFNLSSYIKEILLSINHKVKNRNINIEFNPQDDIEIESYPGFFYQIFTNLVFNSLIHGFCVDTPQARTGEIMIEISRLNNDLIINYKDNGYGIKEEIINRVFDPFFTTKRGTGGSGLGLSIVYNIITQNLGGHITCESEENSGVNFIITLPV